MAGLTSEVGKDVFVHGAWGVALWTPMRVFQSCLNARLTKTVTTFGHVRHIDDIKANGTSQLGISVRAQDARDGSLLDSLRDALLNFGESCRETAR